MLSRHDLTTLAHEVLRHDGVSFDSLPEPKRLTILAAAETADRMHQDVRAAVAECWAELVEAIRLDSPTEPRGPHR